MKKLLMVSFVLLCANILHAQPKVEIYTEIDQETGNTVYKWRLEITIAELQKFTRKSGDRRTGKEATVLLNCNSELYWFDARKLCDGSLQGDESLCGIMVDFDEDFRLYVAHFLLQPPEDADITPHLNTRLILEADKGPGHIGYPTTFWMLQNPQTDAQGREHPLPRDWDVHIQIKRKIQRVDPEHPWRPMRPLAPQEAGADDGIDDA